MFEEALEVDPEYAQAHAGLGEALWRQYQITNELRWVDAALESCAKAVELDELDAEGHVCLGTLYSGTGRFDEAVHEFKLAKSLDPSRDLVFKGLADSFLALGNTELAENTYREAVAVRPHYWAPYNWLGIFYHRQGRIEEAMRNFEEVVRLAPDSYLGYSNLGTAYYFFEQTDKARESFERALEIKSDDDLALSNLATLSFFEGDYEKAVELFERAVAINDKDYFNWGNLADAYHWSPGSRDQADAAYRRAVSLCEEQLVINPKDAVLLGDLAYYQAMLGSEEQAIGSIERALELMPSDIDIQHRAGQVYETLGRSDLALRYLGQAVANGYPSDEIAVDPLFEDLRDNPQFQALVSPHGE